MPKLDPSEERGVDAPVKGTLQIQIYLNSPDYQGPRWKGRKIVEREEPQRLELINNGKVHWGCHVWLEELSGDLRTFKREVQPIFRDWRWVCGVPRQGS